MDNFIVSARKYRPTTFDSVIGQASITNTLKNAIKNHHLAQAFLFCGPRGVGKTTCARILAKTINCDNVSENLEACDQCESCTSFNESHSFNIHELDAASNNSVDDIRHLIEQVRIAPQVGNYSIYIIDEVHMLSVSAFNAFLKTLEEPPPYAVFILATTSKQKIIPTILSRCQIFDFSRIQVEDIAKHLGHVSEQEGVKAEPDALHIIAQKADGSLRDALSIFDQMVSFGGDEVTYNDVIENLNILDYDYYFKAIDALLERDISSSLLLFDEVLSNGFDGHNYITGLSEHVRNLLVCKDEATLQLLQVGEKIKGRYKQQAESCPAAMLLDTLSLTNKCDMSYTMSINKRLHVEILLMQLCSIENLNIDRSPKVKIIPPANQEVQQVAESKVEYQVSDSKEDTVENKELPKESVAVEKETTVSPEEVVPDTSKQSDTPEQKSPPTIEEAEEVVPDTAKQSDTSEQKSQPTIEEAEEVIMDSESQDIVKVEEEDLSNDEKSIEGQSETLEEKETASPKEELIIEKDTSEGEKEGSVPDDSDGEYKLQTKSLKDFVQASGESEKKSELIEDTYGNVTITEERFAEVWQQYADKIRDEGKHSLYSTMTKRKPVLTENNIVTLDIDNTVQESELNAEGTDLHEFLRKELDNGSIKIEVNVLKVQEDRKPYTSMEKFKRMAEKNPSIEKFRKQLDLDID